MSASRPRLNGFEFLECLGQGAFGQVWKACDLGLDALRAVKIVGPARFREQDVRRLLAEARAMARLPHHRNRVSVHQIKDGITNCFLIMDYIAGGSFDRLTSAARPMPWPRAVRYIAGVGDGLLEVHQRGCLHRDIKPSNILLDPERDEAVLGDFGLAVALGSADGVAGTRAYMAPEVSRGGRASPRSDVYSLAASLLHLVTGGPPRPLPAGETSPEADVATSLDLGAAPGGALWPSDVPQEVRALIAAGMGPDPQQRPDLPRFLGVLREARWQRLAEDVLRRQPREPAPVRLQASLAVAPADAPDSFTPLAAEDLHRRRLRTGDLVRIESVASANGYQTILLLGSAGEVEVVLPRPNAEANFFAAGQRHRLLLRLTPPQGRERVLVVWSRDDVRGSAREWREWLERRGEAFVRTAAQTPGPAVRGMEVLGSAPGLAPQGSWRALVLSLEHASPGLDRAEGTGNDGPAG
jgi:serine/threonine-protein kinase